MESYPPTFPVDLAHDLEEVKTTEVERSNFQPKWKELQVLFPLPILHRLFLDFSNV
jgi:hypothetical protein